MGEPIDTSKLGRVDINSGHPWYNDVFNWNDFYEHAVRRNESFQLFGEGPYRVVLDVTTKLEPANARQVGGQHYASSIQHWDYVAANNLGFFEAQVMRYLTRWHKKDGVEGLHKARHVLDKLIENVEAGNYGGTNAAHVKEMPSG